MRIWNQRSLLSTSKDFLARLKDSSSLYLPNFEVFAMTQTPVKLSFEEYLTYDDGTDKRYELVDGELVPMTPASPKHSDIAEFSSDTFKAEVRRLGRDWKVKQGDVGVRTQASKSRLPDVSVISGEVWRNLMGNPKAVLTVPLLLAVEVISPNNRSDDTVDKVNEYQAIGIPEYWTVDWDTDTPNVTVRRLVNGLYQERVFTGTQRIISQTFPELYLTAEQVLSA